MTPAFDIDVRFACGCVVTWLRASHFRSSRSASCDRHKGQASAVERQRIVQAAKQQLAEALQGIGRKYK